MRVRSGKIDMSLLIETKAPLFYHDLSFGREEDRRDDKEDTEDLVYCPRLH